MIRDSWRGTREYRGWREPMTGSFLVLVSVLQQTELAIKLKCYIEREQFLTVATPMEDLARLGRYVVEQHQISLTPYPLMWLPIQRRKVRKSSYKGFFTKLQSQSVAGAKRACMVTPQSSSRNLINARPTATPS